MTIEEILEDLRDFNPTFPRKALTEAIAQREALIPPLLDSLDYVNDHAEELMQSNTSYFLPTYAMYLLAQFREQRAFPRLIRLISHEDKEVVDCFLGDTLTEDYAEILYSTFNGELKLLEGVIENTALYEYSRSAALRAYSYLAQTGVIGKEELISYFRSLIYERLKDEEKPSFLLTAIGSEVIDWHLFELIPDIRYLLDQGAVDLSIWGGYASLINFMFDYRHPHKRSLTIDDTIAEMENWASFRGNETVPREPSPQKKVPQKPVPPEPPSQKKKIGRNDPCPCGSGKKYKHCCLNKPAPRLEDLLKNKPEGQGLAAKTTLARPKPPEKDNGWLKELFNPGPYDLMTDYPEFKEAVPGGAVSFAEYFNPRGIEIDIPVYQALYHRAIPIFVKRDKHAEDLERIDLLSTAFKLFTDCCDREGLSSFDAFDEKYMVHYYSSLWVHKLRELLTGYEDELSEEQERLLDRVSGVIERMSPPGA